MKKVNILIVDDETLIREGLQIMLKSESFINSIYQAKNADEFAAHLNKPIDIILLDVRLREMNGISLIHMHKDKISSKIIAVTGLEGIELIINLLKAGVHGIVYKLNGYTDVLKAIEAVLKGGVFFTDDVLRIIQNNSRAWDSIPSATLSYQEAELIREIANGSTTKAISLGLRMSEKTIETYRIRLMKKLGVANTAALIAYAYRNGIL